MHHYTTFKYIDFDHIKVTLAHDEFKVHNRRQSRLSIQFDRYVYQIEASHPLCTPSIFFFSCRN